MLSTIETHGAALRIRCTTPELADHYWQHRRRLLQLTGAQRLLLVVELGCQAPVQLTWEPPPLPPPAPARRPRRSDLSSAPCLR